MSQRKTGRKFPMPPAKPVSENALRRRTTMLWQVLTLESIKNLAIPGAGLKRPETIEQQDGTLSIASLAGGHGARVYENAQEM
ncbi:hypothetical protein TRIATDRAFT_308123 [Trichoderma atroviride IMI 206040]|uniref:Uncharacterized protein n=1 Tax=Hypocrea atroviridis (strain ATCC 20476 / IMI 206040) TaxID=452589 RepID=G9NTS5_HYPAI|nr:uncharacterized protein TRIATDRAFT_308123 [Trichoderma atroviride IMI 206040]EHK46113.1 hypothetical protein TRIATDRAFT_308123 [Trichoderma atroviride IMI 206040]